MSDRKTEAEERVLVEAARKDPARFTDLYERHFDRVYAFVAHRVSSRDIAQDITADVFHQALAKIGQFEWRGVPFSAWLFRIAENAMADRWKRVSRESGSPAPEESSPAEADMEAIERRARLFQAVRTLPVVQRRVIQMRFSQEKSIREIAQTLRRTEGAVKQLQFRALQHLRDAMASKKRAVIE